jgi:hypothetical protein
MGFSGIITTNLGKTATLTKVAGRERRVHHSKSLPLLFTGERFFFGIAQGRPGPPPVSGKVPEIQLDTPITDDTEETLGAPAFGLRARFAKPPIRSAEAGREAEEQR